MKNTTMQTNHVNPIILEEDFKLKEFEIKPLVSYQEEKVLSLKSYMIALEIKCHALLS
jgi:hypothetical protein